MTDELIDPTQSKQPQESSPGTQESDGKSPSFFETSPHKNFTPKFLALIGLIVILGAATFGGIMIYQGIKKGSYSIPTYSPRDMADYTAADWVKAPEGRYPVLIWHPGDWTFSGGGDKDSESNATIFPPGSLEDSSRRIVVTDYGLVDPQKGSIDFQVSVSADEKVGLLRQLLSANAQELQGKNIENLNANAYVFRASGGTQQHPFYPGPDRGLQPSREIYVINLGDGVISVTFENYDEFTEEFIDDFLGRLELNSLDTSDWLTYRNEEFGFEFNYPVDWYFSDLFDYEIDDNTIFGLRVFGPESDPTSVKFEINSLDGESNINRYNFGEVTGTKPLELNGISGIKMDSQSTINDCWGRKYIFEKPDLTYAISFLGCPTHPEGYNQSREDVANTFKLTN